MSSDGHFALRANTAAAAKADPLNSVCAAGLFANPANANEKPRLPGRGARGFSFKARF
jgi:hypothetical protein